ncbi:MAG TPA: ABC transporter permease [Candidatus Limnocylindrales bacterium]|nr:ABC transporter permease [Candidatus Limnocylindrales bacterium]
MGVVPFDGFGAAAPVVRAASETVSRRERYRRGWLTFVETLKLALDALRTHKLRSFLTLLGVILAVTTLVSVMSVIAGLNFYVADRIANLGANTYLIHRFGIITSEDAWIKAQKRPYITMEEFTRLKESMKTAQRIAGEEDQNSDVRYENILLENCSVVGVTPNYAEIENLNLAQGRFLTEADELHNSEVIFIGSDVKKKFFPTVDPIGKTIRAGTHAYEVIGVAQEIGSVFGQSQDNFILMPLSTYVRGWKTQMEGLTLFVQARNAEIMETSQDEARMYMRAMRHLGPKAEDNFAIFGSASIMSLWEQITGNLFFMATALTSVFLVVGGIVIMNIMLASVTERTREIGLRRSLGARKKHIVLQFLTESAVLSLVGGLMGLVLAYGVVSLAKALTPIPMQTPISAVIISLALSLSVGLFFGIYPATRAAKLDPIEALRAEG